MELVILEKDVIKKTFFSEYFFLIISHIFTSFFPNQFIYNLVSIHQSGTKKNETIKIACRKFGAVSLIFDS